MAPYMHVVSGAFLHVISELVVKALDVALTTLQLLLKLAQVII